MKISQMSTAQAAKAMLQMMEPVQNILKDEKLLPAINTLMNMGNVESVIAYALKEVFPLLLDAHAKDAYAIIGALNGKSADVIAKQNILKTIEEIKDCFDQDLIDFFKSSGAAQKTAGEESALI